MPLKILLLSKPKLAKENRLSRADEKIEPVFQQVGSFLQENSRIEAVFSGTSLTMKDSTEYQR